MLYKYPSSISLDFDLYWTGYAVFLSAQTLPCELRSKLRQKIQIVWDLPSLQPYFSNCFLAKSIYSPTWSRWRGFQYTVRKLYICATPMPIHGAARRICGVYYHVTNRDLKFDSTVQSEILFGGTTHKWQGKTRLEGCSISCWVLVHQKSPYLYLSWFWSRDLHTASREKREIVETGGWSWEKGVPLLIVTTTTKAGACDRKAQVVFVFEPNLTLSSSWQRHTIFCSSCCW